MGKKRLLCISLAATLTNNSYLIYEKLLIPFLIFLNLVQNQHKLKYCNKGFTQQLQGFKSGRMLNEKHKYPNDKKQKVCHQNSKHVCFVLENISALLLSDYSE